MANSLFDFGKTKLDSNIQSEKELEDKATKENIDIDSAKSIYEKYKNCSKSELLEKLHSVISNGKKDGALSQAKIDDTIKNLSPFLNENQKNFLNSIMKDVND